MTIRRHRQALLDPTEQTRLAPIIAILRVLETAAMRLPEEEVWVRVDVLADRRIDGYAKVAVPTGAVHFVETLCHGLLPFERGGPVGDAGGGGVNAAVGGEDILRVDQVFCVPCRPGEGGGDREGAQEED